MLLLPILLAATMMFCTTQNENDYPLMVTGNSDVLYSDVDLYLNPERADELEIEKRDWGSCLMNQGHLLPELSR